MVTDPIADMLTRIRNALVARHDFTDMPASKARVALAQVSAPVFQVIRAASGLEGYCTERA